MSDCKVKEEDEEEDAVQADSDDDCLHIDEPPLKLMKVENCEDNLSQDPHRNDIDENASVKPIQAVFQRARPINHSKQTRYGTRTRSSSLPARVSRYSEGETPFACDTKLSLIELAGKLAAADRKVNGQKNGDKGNPRQIKNLQLSQRAAVVALRKKIQTLNESEVKNGPSEEESIPSFQLPSNVIDPQSFHTGAVNGNSENQNASNAMIIQSPEDLSTDKFIVVKVDTPIKQQFEKLTVQQTNVLPVKIPEISKQIYLQNEKVRCARKSLELLQRKQALEAEVKMREMECVRRLELQREREKQMSAQAAMFNTKAIKFFDDAIKALKNLNAEPFEEELTSVPAAEGLPLWPLISATTKEQSIQSNNIFQSKLSNVIKESTSDIPDKKKINGVEDLDDKNINITSGMFAIPKPLSTDEADAVEHKALICALKYRMPKFARRSFEAARFAAETGKRNVISSEEIRRERELRGFGPPGLNYKGRHIAPKLFDQTSSLFHSPNTAGVKVENDIRILAPQRSSMPMSLLPTKSSKEHQQNPSNLKPHVNPVVLAALNTNDLSRSSSPQSTDGSRKHKCPECDYQTDNRSHLRRHLGSVHSDVKLFSCYVCDKEFARGEKCKAHIEKEHPDIEYDYRKIRKHSIQLSSMDPGTLLDLSTTDSNGHVTGVPYSVVPATKFPNKAEGGSNVTQKSSSDANDSSGHPCQKCNYIGRDSWHLQRHMAEIHAAVCSLKCGVCNYSTTRRHRMVTHMKNHGELFCFYCDFSTVNPSLFNAHIKVCTALWRATLLTCVICQKVFNSRKALQSHLSAAHFQETFFCDLCPYSSGDFQQFEKHSEYHFSGDIECQCMKCNELFVNTKELLIHSENCTANSHIGEEREVPLLACEMCSFSTTFGSEMKAHFFIHTDEAIKCPIKECGFKARWPTSLALHQMYKHKAKEKAKSTASPVSQPQQTEPAPKTQPKLTNQLPTQANTLDQPSDPTLPYPTLSTSHITSLSSAFPLLTSVSPTISLPLSLSALQAIPVFAATSNIPLLQSPMIPILPTATVPNIVIPKLPKPLKITKPKNTPKPERSTSAVYDATTGGLRGHGSGNFTCPYCPERAPFKYRRSYEKHMYRHQKERATLKSSVDSQAAASMKVKCSLCGENYRNDQIKHHLQQIHGRTAAFDQACVVVIDDDDDDDVDDDEVIEVPEKSDQLDAEGYEQNETESQGRCPSIVESTVADDIVSECYEDESKESKDIQHQTDDDHDDNQVELPPKICITIKKNLITMANNSEKGESGDESDSSQPSSLGSNSSCDNNSDQVWSSCDQVLGTHVTQNE